MSQWRNLALTPNMTSALGDFVYAPLPGVPFKQETGDAREERPLSFSRLLIVYLSCTAGSTLVPSA
jgi:hypothetical protein